MKFLIEIIGWVAVAMMLSAYMLLTAGRLSSNSPVYQWLNVLSGAGFVVNSGWNGAYPPAFINVMWAAIGLYGVFRGIRTRPGRAA
ncbi:MAG: CBU_0592 family membrane protein [Steroidobacteraceae bacterium]